MAGALFLPITAFYTGLLAVCYITICTMVALYRYFNDIMYGDKGDETLLHWNRAQTNMGEYIPLALLMLAMAEINTIHTATPIWVMGGLLTFFRVIAAVQLMWPRLPLLLRQAGFVGTACWYVTVGVTLIVRCWYHPNGAGIRVT